MDMATVHHPGLGTEVDVPASAVPHHVAAGWVPGPNPQDAVAPAESDGADDTADGEEPPTSPADSTTTTKGRRGPSAKE